MIVGVCGFTGTGSSAVSDYLKEFETTSVIDDFEFTLINGVDGIEDLDFQINTHSSKYTSSYVAIERFKTHIYNYYVQRVNDKQIKKDIINCTRQYLSKIVQVEWIGYGGADIQLYSHKKIKNKIFSVVWYRLFMQINKRLPYYIKRVFPPFHTMSFSISPSNFDVETKSYILKMIELLGGDIDKVVVLDQLFSGSNPLLGLKYFDDAKAIIVDRDPRDLYVQMKYYTQRKGRQGYQVPTEDVEKFCEYYLSLRKNREKILLDSRVKLINLEDLIYEYDKTTKDIIGFCGISLEDRKNIYFDPSLSIANTQLYKRVAVPKKDIEYIEKELSPYLYDFDKYGNIKIVGEPFPNKSPLNK